MKKRMEVQPTTSRSSGNDCAASGLGSYLKYLGLDRGCPPLSFRPEPRAAGHGSSPTNKHQSAFNKLHHHVWLEECLFAYSAITYPGRGEAQNINSMPRSAHVLFMQFKAPGGLSIRYFAPEEEVSSDLRAPSS